MSSNLSFSKGKHLVSEGAVVELRDFLTAHPAVLNHQDQDGVTLLGFACKEATCNETLPPQIGEGKHFAVVKLLLDVGADPHLAALDGWVPLHAAARTGNLELANLLFDAGTGTDGKLMNSDGGTPLSLALFYAQTEIAEHLAHPPNPDNLRSAAALGRELHHFFEGEQLSDQAKTGLEFYRPIPAFPEWNRTLSREEVINEALTWAARNNQCGSLQALVDKGADVNSNVYRGTALLWAIYGNQVESAEWLLQNGADPDLKHDFGGKDHGKGAVAMHLAAQYGSLQCLELLLAHGADSTIKDDAFGGTPLDWARHCDSPEAADILSSLG